ncbi:DUF2871 domain-containing protein [Devriesea agamarum]|uniref:DUF2871 domain-containing protein n=1 Tax=Devriesea agamarum TaxID=472569 RepID=UPI00071D6CF0|nr:DUF2871 domain-containing protein [Devriesea agamarum]
MKRIYWSVVLYTVLGLVAGVFYREFTKALGFTGHTQLATLHTHFLALGTLVFLIVLLLVKVFDLDRTRYFSGFFWVYNGGLILTTALMTVRGCLQALGNESPLPALSGIAGLGHIALAVGLALLLICLGRAVSEAERTRRLDASHNQS